MSVPAPEGQFVQLTTTEESALAAHQAATARGWTVLGVRPPAGRSGLPSKTTGYAPAPTDAVALRRLVGWQADPTADTDVRVQWREYVHHDPEQGYYNDAVLDVISDGSVLTYVEHDEPADALTALFVELDAHWRR